MKIFKIVLQKCLLSFDSSLFKMTSWDITTYFPVLEDWPHCLMCVRVLSYCWTTPQILTQDVMNGSMGWWLRQAHLGHLLFRVLVTQSFSSHSNHSNTILLSWGFTKKPNTSLYDVKFTCWDPVLQGDAISGWLLLGSGTLAVCLVFLWTLSYSNTSSSFPWCQGTMRKQQSII